MSETFVPAGMKATDLTPLLRNPVENLMMGAECVIKEFVMPAGSTIVQHKHKYPHPSVLVKGDVTLTVDGNISRLSAPQAILIRAHFPHRIQAVTDAVWLCIHHDNEESKWIES